MERKQMQKIVDAELERIPRGPAGSPQNLFRQAYTSQRLYSLGRNANLKLTKEEVLKLVIDEKRKTNPKFKPSYDRDFFIIEG